LERASLLDEACRRYLRSEGTGYRTQRGAIWVDSSGRAWEPGSAEFLSFLAHQGGAPAGAAEFVAAAKGAARTVCFVEHRQEAQAMGLSAIGLDGAIYIRRDEASMFRVDATISVVPNGTAGLLLRPLDGFQPIGELPSATAPHVVYPWMHLLAGFPFHDFASPNVGATLLAVTLISLLLPRDVVGVHPAIAFIGPAGSGKTSAARTCSILLCGRALVEMPPDAWSVDSFETALSRLAVLPIDDFDEADSKFAALIRAVLTGAQRTRRKKYSDDDLHVLQPEVRLLFATNVCPLQPTDANVSRLLPLRFGERTSDFLVEGSVEQQAVTLRAQFWADALEMIRLLCRPLQTAPIAGQRLAGWERFVRTFAATSSAWTPFLIPALDVVDQVRCDLQLADDLVAENLSNLIPFPGSAWQGTASELLLTLRTGPAHSLWSRWTPERLAKRMLSIAPALRRALGIHVMRLPRSATTRGYRIWRQ
jgi:hypothetical protein